MHHPSISRISVPSLHTVSRVSVPSLHTVSRISVPSLHTVSRIGVPSLHTVSRIGVPSLHTVFRKEERKEMFYLTTHSTHFILRLYGVRHMVKDHSDSERGNQLPPHGLLFPINSKGSFICTIPQTG